MTLSQRHKLIKSIPDYGQIVCKCECVSLGEIKEALNSPLKPTSVDAVKRRVRAGMGRCQGGFCLTKVIQTISETCKISEMNVVKENLGSNFYVSDINPEK
jgi:glycerol-3-phosphate dehydrogenase